MNSSIQNIPQDVLIKRRVFSKTGAIPSRVFFKMRLFIFCVLVTLGLMYMSSSDCLVARRDPKCFNCLWLNRNGPHCAKDHLECTDCIPLFENLPRAPKLQKNPCVRMNHNLIVPPVCRTDEHCDDGFHCFQNSTCMPCTDCHKFYRYQPEECAPTVIDCGGCFPGFREVLNGTVFVCEPKYQKPCLFHNHPHKHSMIGLIVSVCILAFSVVAMVIVFCHKRFRARSIKKNSRAEKLDQ